MRSGPGVGLELNCGGGRPVGEVGFFGLGGPRVLVSPGGPIPRGPRGALWARSGPTGVRCDTRESTVGLGTPGFISPGGGLGHGLGLNSRGGKSLARLTASSGERLNSLTGATGARNAGVGGGGMLSATPEASIWSGDIPRSFAALDVGGAPPDLTVKGELGSRGRSKALSSLDRPGLKTTAARLDKRGFGGPDVDTGTGIGGLIAPLGGEGGSSRGEFEFREVMWGTRFTTPSVIIYCVSTAGW